MILDRPLSALELTVLGVILKRGPCVAHAVVAEFSHSTTFAYRSGAGSIYPLLKRLTKVGLVSVEAKKYTLTDAGTEALRAWIRPPFQASDFTTTLDVLRSRVYFLKLLSLEEIAEFLSSALAGLDLLLKDWQDNLASYVESGDKFSELAMKGAVKETEARIEWLREIQKSLNVPGS